MENLLELEANEFNFVLLDELFSTKSYLENHKIFQDNVYGILDGVDQAKLVYEVYIMVSDYILESKYSDASVDLAFDDRSFVEKVDKHILNFKSTI